MPALLLRFAPHIIGALAIIGFAWWIADMRSDLRDERIARQAVERNLEALQIQQRKDVAGLTALAAGNAKAAADDKRDQKILAESVNAIDPKPLSRPLARLLCKLRVADASGSDDPAASASGRAALAACIAG